MVFMGGRYRFLYSIRVLMVLMTLANLRRYQPFSKYCGAAAENVLKGSLLGTQKTDGAIINCDNR